MDPLRKVDYKEIFKLKVMLDEAHIDYEFYDRGYILSLDEEHEKYITNNRIYHYQIIIYKDKEKKDRLISVVQGTYTYGGEDDLLEIMGCLTPKEEKLDMVVGYLTAKQVFRRIKKNLKED